MVIRPTQKLWNSCSPLNFFPEQKLYRSCLGWSSHFHFTKAKQCFFFFVLIRKTKMKRHFHVLNMCEPCALQDTVWNHSLKQDIQQGETQCLWICKNSWDIFSLTHNRTDNENPAQWVNESGFEKVVLPAWPALCLRTVFSIHGINQWSRHNAQKSTDLYIGWSWRRTKFTEHPQNSRKTESLQILGMCHHHLDLQSHCGPKNCLRRGLLCISFQNIQRVHCFKSPKPNTHSLFTLFWGESFLRLSFRRTKWTGQLSLQCF